MRIIKTCLLGIKNRCDGKIKKNKRILELSKKEVLIFVFPEKTLGLENVRKNVVRNFKNIVAYLNSNGNELLNPSLLRKNVIGVFSEEV